MKSKSYWAQASGEGNIFDLPQKLSQGIEQCRKNLQGQRGEEAAVRYIWIYLTDRGLRYGHQATADSPTLTLDDWLNIIDESAALGAQWMVVYVGASLGNSPHIWRMCQWAQDVHGLNVGLHLTSDCLSEDDTEQLVRLDRDHTYLVADESSTQSFHFLEEKGFHVCTANTHLRDGIEQCSKPANIACVGADGQLFSCGLVLGEKAYALGDARERRLNDVLTDDTLPHEIVDATPFPHHGCDGCPPLMEEHIRRREDGKTQYTPAERTPTS